MNKEEENKKLEKKYEEKSSKDFIAKKSLGQNFLHAPNIINRMVYEARVDENDIVLEVGPGKGALTEKLLLKKTLVIAVEKDDRAIEYLNNKFSLEIKKGKLILIHEDILNFDENKHGLKDRNYTIVANIPYYISGEFLKKFLDSKIQPKRILVMLQKELAKRILDKKGSILSISVKVFGNPKYIVSVPRKLFRPIPNVDSALIIIDNISNEFFINSNIDKTYFFDIVKSGFSHKRKVLIRNLEKNIDIETLKEFWIDAKLSNKIRAEELSIDDWKKMAIFTSRFPQK